MIFCMYSSVFIVETSESIGIYGVYGDSYNFTLKEKKLKKTKRIKKQLKNWYLKINSLMSTTHIQLKKSE